MGLLSSRHAKTNDVYFFTVLNRDPDLDHAINLDPDPVQVGKFSQTNCKKSKIGYFFYSVAEGVV